MNWRAMALSGIFVAGLTLSFVSRASADPPPWAGVWRVKHHHGDDDCDDRPYYGTRYYPRDHGRCGKITDRIRFDQSKVAEIAPTGRHRKALQWYRDDIVNAERDLDRCRYGDVEAAQDPYYRSGRYDDPYYDDRGRSFEWKRDWPLLLGDMLYPQQR